MRETPGHCVPSRKAHKHLSNTLTKNIKPESYQASRSISVLDIKRTETQTAGGHQQNLARGKFYRTNELVSSIGEKEVGEPID